MSRDDLIARLEAATGPDRELDAAIQMAVGGRIRSDGVPVWDGHFIGVGAYTSDVNAAMKLVPPDCWQEIKGPRKYLNIPHPVPNVWSAYIAKWNHEGDVMGWGATPALAICIASLKARNHAG